MQWVHRDLTVCEVRPRPVHTYVLEASPLRSIASICPGGFARHYNRARGTRVRSKPPRYPYCTDVISQCDARYRK